ncbi:MAG: aconitate hydratase, partial [Candidatus Kapaibacteriota bacterium]
KKQGMLPLTFTNAADYELFKEGDVISIDITMLAPGKTLEMHIAHADGSSDAITVKHTMNDQQIGWFKAGSALNLIAGNN